MNIKKITALSLAISLVTTTALASILGSENYSSVEMDIASGTKYYNNVFISDQSGVGKQTENYFTYTPNDGIKPIIVNDTYLYGRTKVSAMVKKMENSGLYPIMVMNNDYFSLQTGVPMGHQISKGVVITKDSQGEDAIGILKDGSAFISWLQVDTTITVGDTSFRVENVNKYIQPYSIYLLTDKFSDTTKYDEPTYNVIIGGLSDELLINKEISGTVEQIIESDKAISIPKGKIVLSVDKRVAQEKMDNLKLLKEGEQIKIKNSAEGDARWKDCDYIQGCIGGRLIKDGEIQSVDQAAAPRSAIGVKADGSLIFYTIDGRQTGHSYGVRLKTLSARLKELGCVDAVNLDGGGSTTIAGLYPGDSSLSLLNKPSDGQERAVSTFFALENTRGPSGIAGNLHIYPAGGNYLSGATQKFTVKATDTNDHPITYSEKITFSSDGSTYTSDKGYAKIIGNGKVRVYAQSGDLKASAAMTVFSTPDTITLRSAKTSSVITSLDVRGNESVQILASATVDSKNIISDNGCYTWKCDENIGSINSDGIFTATDAYATGNIIVTAGNKTVKLPVTVNGDKYALFTKMGFEQNENSVKVTLSNADNVNVEKANINVSLDGKRADFTYKDNVITIPTEGQREAKLKVALTNSEGKRTIKVYTISGNAYTNNFTDTKNHWAKNVIAYMNDKKIVNGVKVPDGTLIFNPDKNITRAEFSVMVANYLGINPNDYSLLKAPFADEKEIPSWASGHIKALYTMGIINGKTRPDTSIIFDSNANITRAEAVTILGRILGENIASEEFRASDLKDIPPYAYDGFVTMSSMGVISGYLDGTIRPLNTITRAEAVKLLYGIY